MEFDFIQESDRLKQNYNLPEDGFHQSPAHKKETDKRIDYYLENPNDLLDLEEVEQHLLARIKR